METLFTETLGIVERGVLFKGDPDGPHRVACYPTLSRLSNGDVLCVFRVGRTKSGPDESMRLARSTDGGVSWLFMPCLPDCTLDGVPGSMASGSVVEIAPGHLRVQGNWINRSDPSAPISHPETAGCLELKIVATESRDGGQSWSPIAEVAGCPFEQPEVSGAMVALSNPLHLLQPMENQKSYFDSAPIDEKAFALISHDGGHTWPDWAMIAHDHPARKFWCNRVAKLPSGALACVSWTFDVAAEKDLPLHLTIGSADGLNWGEPFSTGVCGQVSHLLALDDGRLLMATSHRESPASIRLRTSRDGGHSWDGDGLLVLDAEDQASRSGGDLADYYHAMTAYSFGWAPMVRLDDDTILLAHFAGSGESIGVYWVKIAL